MARQSDRLEWETEKARDELAASLDQLLVDADVFLRHATGGEPLLEPCADASTVQTSNAFNSAQAGVRLDHEAGDTIFDNFRN